MNQKSARRTPQFGAESAPARVTPGDPVQLLVSVPTMWSEPQATVVDLARQLSDEHVGAVLVMRGAELAGLISERDLLRVLESQENATDVWVADVMTSDPVQVDGITPIGTAALTMLDEGVRHLAVTSEGHLIGIVSMRDVLRVLADHWLHS